MASRPTRAKVYLPAVIRCASQKVSFASHAEAWDAAERMMDQGKVWPGCHMTPYACADCGRWHVYNRRIVWPGRPPGRPRKEARQ